MGDLDTIWQWIGIFSRAVVCLALTAGVICMPGCRKRKPTPATSGPNEPASSNSTSIPEGQTNSQRMAPPNHKVRWEKRHAPMARSNPTECMECHVEQDCSSCHSEEVATPFSVHPPDFVTVHAETPRLDRQECTQCHQPETFCAPCHSRTDTTPTERPVESKNIHPPGWLESDGTNNHAEMARRNITECASCHTEDDCTSCHASVNPHPPGFATECERWLEANSRACAKCHSKLSSLRQLCR